MNVFVIAIVGGGIATGFYYMNKETATSPQKLRESTAMVFVLSTAVLLMANFLGLGEGGPGGGGAAVGGGGGGGGPDVSFAAVPFDYVMGGDPPF